RISCGACRSEALKMLICPLGSAVSTLRPSGLKNTLYKPFSTPVTGILSTSASVAVEITCKNGAEKSSRGIAHLLRSMFGMLVGRGPVASETRSLARLCAGVYHPQQACG